MIAEYSSLQPALLKFKLSGPKISFHQASGYISAGINLNPAWQILTAKQNVKMFRG
jgi:hypothetical protein